MELLLYKVATIQYTAKYRLPMFLSTQLCELLPIAGILVCGDCLLSEFVCRLISEHQTGLLEFDSRVIWPLLYFNE